jgi:hypothetical protein
MTSSTASNSAFSVVPPPPPVVLYAGYPDQSQALAGVAKAAEGVFYEDDYLQTTSSFAAEAMDEIEGESVEGYGIRGGLRW